MGNWVWISDNDNRHRRTGHFFQGMGSKSFAQKIDCYVEEHKVWKIQVLIIYPTVYGDSIILMNYQSLSTRWWAQVKKVNGSIWKGISDSDSENSTNMIYEYIQLNRNQQTRKAIQSN